LTHIETNIWVLTIVVEVNKQRMQEQDVDNVAKVVIDALKRDENIRPGAFLFYDDTQIARLLVYKISREEDEIYDTDKYIISFRRHDPNKQMSLKESHI